jgi:hypothetical protein
VSISRGLVAILLGLPSLADAVEYSISNTSVTAVSTNLQAGFYITVTGNSADCYSTFTPKRYYVTAGQNNYTEPGADNILANVTMAMIAGKPVKIFFEGGVGNTNCYLNRVVVDES